MALEVQSGIIQLSTLTLGATHAISLSGFSAAPKFAVFWINGRSEAANTVGRANHDRGGGFATGTSSRRAIGGRALDNVDNTDVSGGLRDDCVIVLVNAAGSASTGRVDVTTWSSSQIVLTNDEALDHAITVMYWVVGGSDITNVYLDHATEPAATGTQSYTGAGFQPDAVLFMAEQRTAINSQGPDCVFSFGAAVWRASDGTLEQAVTAAGINDNNGTSDSLRWQRTDQCVAAFNGGVNAIATQAQMDSRSSTGFTLNWTARAGSRLFPYLAIKGGKWKIDSFTTSTTPAATSARTGYGFQPSALVVSSRGNTSGTTAVAHDRTSIGVGTGTSNRHALGVSDQDAAAFTNTTTGLYVDAIYANVNNGAAVGLGDISAIASDGWTFINDDADDAANEVWVLALGPNASGTSYTLTADSASVAISATDAGLRAARRLNAESVGVTITGTAAALLFGRRLSAESAGYSITGTDAALRRGRFVVADPATISITATAAALRATRRIVADAASIAITAQDVTLSRGRRLTAESASYAISGTPATLSLIRALVAAGATVTIDGQPATLRAARRLLAESAAYVITPSDALLQFSGAVIQILIGPIVDIRETTPRVLLLVTTPHAKHVTPFVDARNVTPFARSAQRSN